VVLQSTQIRKDAKMKKSLKENWFVSPSSYTYMFLYCVVSEKIHSYPTEGQKFLGGWGSSKPKFKKQSMK